jgi:putative ABC transport system permease protein
MKATTLVRVAGQSILKNKMRTLLTMLGIIIGVGAVIIMVAIGAGARRQIQQSIQSLGTNMLVVTPGAATTGGVSQGAQTFTRLTTKDSDILKQQGTLLSGVSPVVMTHAQVVGSTGNWRTMIMGVSPDYQEIRNWPVSDGRFFEASDVAAMRKVIVLGKTVADNLFPDGNAVGQQLRVRNVPVQVIGVLAAKGQTADGNDQDDIILAPYTTVQNRLAGHSFLPQILASTFSPGDILAAQQEITTILRESHGLAPNEGNDFTVRNQNQLSDAASGTTNVMTMLLAAIASISLLVGGIGIMNIMLVSVTERTREIGIRKALGARQRDVLAQFIAEATVISVTGGVIGIVIGVLIGEGVSLLTKVLSNAGAPVPHLPAGIQAWSIILGFLFSLAVGLFFGIYPANKAAKLNPIEALRYE